MDPELERLVADPADAPETTPLAELHREEPRGPFDGWPWIEKRGRICFAGRYVRAGGYCERPPGAVDDPWLWDPDARRLFEARDAARAAAQPPGTPEERAAARLRAMGQAKRRLLDEAVERARVAAARASVARSGGFPP